VFARRTRTGRFERAKQRLGITLNQGPLVAHADSDAEWQYVLRQASELDDHGNEFGDNQALVEAIGVYRRALTLAPRGPQPLDWATTQNNLGTALVTLGARESGTARLEEAVAAYRAALEEWTRDRVPHGKRP
jgi:tetratricopeptide (TPR) repeat protein